MILNASDYGRNPSNNQGDVLDQQRIPGDNESEYDDNRSETLILESMEEERGHRPITETICDLQQQQVAIKQQQNEITCVLKQMITLVSEQRGLNRNMGQSIRETNVPMF